MQTQEAETEGQGQTSPKRPIQKRKGTPSKRGGRQHRRKVSQACDQCRKRKSRCDGSRPACHECAVRPYQRESCTYNSSRNQDRNHEDYISSLLTRIRELEQRHVSASETHCPFSMIAAEEQSGTTINRHAVRNDTMNTHSPEWREPALDSQKVDSCSSVIGPIDAMGAAVNPKAPEQVFGDRFYGSSSTFSFMQQVYQAVQNGVPGSGVTTPLRAQNGPQARATMMDPSALSVSLSQLSLLPRPSMDKLLDIYWTRVYHLYPFLHKPTFMVAYEQLWSSQPAATARGSSTADILGSDSYGPNNIVFHCAMNLMLALATQFMDLPLGERVQLGEMFSERARNLCQLDLFDDGSLAVIQTFLLMTQYLQSTPFPGRCWTWVGVACRMAQGLGLHRESLQRNATGDPLIIQMRRRVWHGCVMLDAVVSMTLGRPLLLHEYPPIPLPLAIDDEYLIDPDAQPEDHVSWMHFLIHNIKLYGILADVGSEIYDLSPHPLVTKTNDNNVNRILELDAAISKLEDGLPTHLHWMRHIMTTGGAETPEIVQQRCVFRSRLLQLRVTLFRPMFARYCQYMCARQSSPASDQGVDSGFLTPVALAIVRPLSMSCVEYSITLIEHLHELSTSSALEAWWYNIFYARTAGAVTILSMACAAMVDAIGWERLMTAWHRCEEVLTNLQMFSRRVSHCLHALQALHQYVLRRRGRVPEYEGSHGGGGGIAPGITTDRCDPTTQSGQTADGPAQEDFFTGYENMVWPDDVGESLFEMFNFDFSQQPMAPDFSAGESQWAGGTIPNHL